MTVPATTSTSPVPVRSLQTRRRYGDRTFRLAMLGAAGVVVLVLLAMVVFLVAESWPALAHYGTVLTSVIGLLIAVPMSVGIALFITGIAPAWLRRPLSYLVDLLASIPSVVFGFWGIFALIPALQPVVSFLIATLGKVPVIGGVFAGPFFGLSYFTAGIVLAIMVLPIVTALCREIFATTPADEREAALALGMTRWEMLRTAVLPRSRAGIMGAAILGLGRAFGETIAVTMVIGNNVLSITKSIFSTGATMASVIATEFTEAVEPFHLDSLFGVAMWLLFISLIVNIVGKLWVRRIRGDLVW